MKTFLKLRALRVFVVHLFEKSPRPLLALCVLGFALLAACTRPSPAPATGNACGNLPPSGCTVFTVSKDDQVFFGGNDDWTNPDSYYWVDPGNGDRYGAIWIGAPDNVQQGVNEKGLAYDANGLPRVDTHPHPERTPVPGDYTVYPLRILHECATVAEVIDWVNTHEWHSYMHDQMQFADASGDAVIISAGADGEVVFTRKPPGDSFLVSTNFNVANPANGYGYPCWRYDTASQRLSALLSRGDVLTAQDAANVLDAVHGEGGTSWTIESMVADLPNGVVYLYSYHQFDRPLVLRVADELANPPAPGWMSRRFPPEVRAEAARRYQRALAGQDRCALIGKAWVGLALASLAAVLVLSLRRPRALVFWLPAAAVLGPLGLLAWLVAGRGHPARRWQAALVEAVGDAVPGAAAFFAAILAILFIPQAQSSQALQLVFIFVLPLLLGWLVFHGPLLAWASRQRYLRMLAQRLPVAWVAANFSIGGIHALSTPLVNQIASACSIMPVTAWTMATLWAAVVAGACVALLLLLLYEGWAVRRGFRAWSALAVGETEVSSPGWRRLWWWILLSFAATVGGVIVSNLLQQALRG